jgi:ribose 5-phosphate isomerase B
MLKSKEGPVRIIIGSDQQHEVVMHLVETAQALGHETLLVGAPTGQQYSWVDVGREVGEAVIARTARYGVVCCSTGTGVAMAANKIQGVRAALCHSPELAQRARLYNHANVLAIGLVYTLPDVATFDLENVAPHAKWR